MSCPKNECAGMGDMSFFPDSVDVQRAVVIHDVTSIRDRKIQSYETIQSSQPCWFEHAGSLIVENGQLGRVVISRYNVWFSSFTTVEVGDRLLRDNGFYYRVEDLRDVSREGFGKQVVVTKMGYASGQA